MSVRTEDELLDERIADLTAWLELMMRPVENWDEVDQHPYRHFDDDVLELGERVADDLLSESSWGCDALGLAVLLEQHARAATDRAPDPATSPGGFAPEPAVPVEPGRVVWSAPAFAPFVLPSPVLRAVTAWLEDNRVVDVSGAHEVRVEAHPDGTRTIVFQQGLRRPGDAAPEGLVAPARGPLRTEPPVLPDLPDLTALGAVLEAHPVGTGHFNLALPIGSQVCCTCTSVANPVVFPCPAVTAAAEQAGVRVYPDDEPGNLDAFDDADGVDGEHDGEVPRWAAAPSASVLSRAPASPAA
ncbi:hypothetical protein [Amycolatopsis sp. NPDC004378]